MKNERRRLKAGTGLIGLVLVLVWLTGCTSPDILKRTTAMRCKTI